MNWTLSYTSGRPSPASGRWDPLAAREARRSVPRQRPRPPGRRPAPATTSRPASPRRAGCAGRRERGRPRASRRAGRRRTPGRRPRGPRALPPRTGRGARPTDPARCCVRDGSGSLTPTTSCCSAIRPAYRGTCQCDAPRIIVLAFMPAHHCGRVSHRQGRWPAGLGRPRPTHDHRRHREHHELRHQGLHATPGAARRAECGRHVDR